jgi:hypothetical protein
VASTQGDTTITPTYLIISNSPTILFFPLHASRCSACTDKRASICPKTIAFNSSANHLTDRQTDRQTKSPQLICLRPPIRRQCLRTTCKQSSPTRVATSNKLLPSCKQCRWHPQTSSLAPAWQDSRGPSRFLQNRQRLDEKPTCRDQNPRVVYPWPRRPMPIHPGAPHRPPWVYPCPAPESMPRAVRSSARTDRKTGVTCPARPPWRRTRR